MTRKVRRISLHTFRLVLNNSDATFHISLAGDVVPEYGVNGRVTSPVETTENITDYGNISAEK